MEQLEGRLHYLESRMVHLHNEEKESVQVMASSSLKLHEDTRKVLNYSNDNFEILQTNLEMLQKTMEEKQQAQACDHRRSDVFMYAFCAQSAINNVSWTLNAMHSEFQVQTLYLTEQRNMFITSIGVLSKGTLPTALVPYEDLRKIITNLKLGDKKCSIPYDHSSLLYSLPLVRNVFSNPHGLLITMEVPVYSGEPIHDAYKAIPLPQPIKNTTTAATLKLERSYLIVSRREESYAEMKSEEYLSCWGTQLLRLCTKPVALVSTQDQLCLTSLLYNHEVAALKTCTREVTELPILPTAIYLGNSMYLLNAADDQQFLYNITYSGGRKFSNRVPACKSCLVQPPCNGKLVHPQNGLVMLPDPAYCLQHSGLITTITTPELLDTAFDIPSFPAVIPTEESRNLILHRIRSALKDVPTLDVTPELVSEMVDKIHQQLSDENNFKSFGHGSTLHTFKELAGLLGFSLWCLAFVLLAVWTGKKCYQSKNTTKHIHNLPNDDQRDIGTDMQFEERLNLVERMRNEETSAD